MNCETCGGSGRAGCQLCSATGKIGHGAGCPTCSGSTKVQCPACRGRGTTPSGHREPDGDESMERVSDHDYDNRPRRR